MRICSYCLIETKDAKCACGANTFDKEYFLANIRVAQLRDSREHWAALDHSYTQGPIFKAERLARFDALLGVLEKK